MFNIFTMVAVLSFMAFGQETGNNAAFDVASVKPATEPVPGALSNMRGGPGTSEPEKITYTKVPLLWVLLKAYGVKDYQVITPEWLHRELYDIIATMPPGTTLENFSLMLQNLLKERFQLTLHHEARQFAVYQLVVDKGGPKIRQSGDVAGEQPASKNTTPNRPDEVAYPQLPPGNGPVSKGSRRNNRYRLSARMITIAQLCGILENQTGRPVVDRTGLPGGFDFKLDFSIVGLGGGMNSAIAAEAAARQAQGLDPLPDDGGPSLFAAVQQQLGLKLESTKAALDVLVIDYANKLPTAN
jgi:uncharacterized protein (TIGR03435 family)